MLQFTQILVFNMGLICYDTGKNIFADQDLEIKSCKQDTWIQQPQFIFNIFFIIYLFF